MVKLGNRYSMLGAGLGILADRAIGDPPNRFDPMAAYSGMMARASGGGGAAGPDGFEIAKRRALGVAAAGTALGATAGWGMKKLMGPLGAATLGAWSTIRGKSRSTRALTVAAALAAGDHATARAALPPMVHAEAESTPDDGIAALAVDAIAEELIDGVVGPALWAAFAGAPGTLAYRGINSLDSLVGHHAARHKQAGLAGDVVDVAANFVPAVVAAVLVVAVRPRVAREIWNAVRDDAGKHPSRSVGMVSEAFDAALGLRPGDNGERRAATPQDVSAAATLSRDVSLGMAGICVVVGGALTIAAARKAASSVPGRGR